eukprot:2222331-Ditylum_brightwellii.AAC.1
MDHQNLDPFNCAKEHYSIRAQKSHCEAEDQDEESRKDFAKVAHYALTQFLVKVGLKYFNKKDEDDISKEFSTLHHKDTFQPLDMMELTKEQKQGLLMYLLFLEKKRDKQIKASARIDVWKQRQLLTKKETAFLTVLTEAVLLTVIISTKGGRDV